MHLSGRCLTLHSGGDSVGFFKRTA